nr:MAG TPA: hypothetical protein [Caudoviricetes sp.]
MNPITIDNLSKIEDATHLMEILLPLGYEVIIKRYKPNPKTSVYKYLFIAREAQK